MCIQSQNQKKKEKLTLEKKFKRSSFENSNISLITLVIIKSKTVSQSKKS